MARPGKTRFVEPGAVVGAFGTAVVRVQVLDELGAWLSVRSPEPLPGMNG
jgi:hypothetical protein